MPGKERNNKSLRFLDKFFGIPLIFVLGIFKKKRSLPKFESRINIGILKTSAIGDTVILSGAIASLRKRYPQATIYFFSGSSNAAAVQFIPGIDHHLTIPVKNLLKAISMIRKQDFDLWMDFGPWPRIDALLSYFSKSNYTVGFKTKNQYRHYVYDKATRHFCDPHEIHENLNYHNLIKLIGVDFFSNPSISLQGGDGIQINNKQIVIHMFAGGSRAYMKEWNPQNWEGLIKGLQEKGFQIYLTGGREDLERINVFVSNLEDTQKIQVVAGEFNLTQTVKLLLGSACTISIDTGVMHLASALGCKTISLHMATSPNRWGGIGDNVHPLCTQVKCSPCIGIGFEQHCDKNLKCSHDISPQSVLDLVDTAF